MSNVVARLRSHRIGRVCGGRGSRHIRHAGIPRVTSDLCPCLIHARHDPLHLGSVDGVITGNYQNRLRDALGLRTISSVAVMRCRDCGNAFVGSGGAYPVFKEVLSHLFALLGCRQEQWELKAVEERPRRFPTKHVRINSQVSQVVVGDRSLSFDGRTHRRETMRGEFAIGFIDLPRHQ